MPAVERCRLHRQLEILDHAHDRAALVLHGGLHGFVADELAGELEGSWVGLARQQQLGPMAVEDGGGAVAVTGYQLMFPFYLSGIEGMQIAQIVHSVVSVLFVAAMLAHIYIGTIGMEGAFEAMGSGTVDVNWAKEHHSLWLEEQNARTGPNEARSQPAATPAE